MKKLLLLFTIVGCATVVMAQSKTVEVKTAGTLTFTEEERNTLVSLQVSGVIDSTDLAALKTLSKLENLDLAQADIVAVGNCKANEIPADMFRENTTLKAIKFPNTLESIGDYAFYTSSAITEFDFSNCPDLKKIGYYACGSIQETLTSISFNGCAALDTIGEYAFAQSKAVENIDFTGCVSLKYIANRAFLNNTSVKMLDLSSCTALTEITANSFRQMKGVETLKLPTTVTNITSNAFYQFSALSSVVCMNTVVPTIASDAFKSTSVSGCTLTVPVGAKADYEADAVWGTFATIIESAGIEGVVVEKSVAKTVIYSISGAQLPTLVRGVNFVKIFYTDGSVEVKKELVR